MVTIAIISLIFFWEEYSAPSISMNAMYLEELGRDLIEIELQNKNKDENFSFTFAEGKIFKYEVRNKETNKKYTGDIYEDVKFVLKSGEKYSTKTTIESLINGKYELIVESVTNEGTSAKLRTSFEVNR